MKKEDKLLQQAFLKGKIPKNLDGFYKGRLLKVMPCNIFESIGGFIAKFWLPWYGKNFYYKQQRGDNVLPSYMASLIKVRYGEEAILKKEYSAIHVFPFKTLIKKGLKDNISVLELNYNLSENPLQVRRIIDELVCTGKDLYLGKAHIKNGNSFRTVAFFQLER